jgi:hypothetical protein
VITTEDVANWNKNLHKTSELEALLKQLIKDFTNLDASKIKADIIQILKMQATFVTKANLNPILEDIVKIRAEADNDRYAMQT